MIRKHSSLFLLLVICAGIIVTGCLQTQTSPPAAEFGIGVENAARLERVATYGEGKALDISLSPDGRWLAIRSTIGIYLYDTQTWDALELNGSHQSVSQVVFSPTGDLLALAVPATNEIELWRLPEAELVHRIMVPGGNYSTRPELSFTPGGDGLIGTSFQAVYLWHVEDGVLIQSRQAPQEAGFKSSSIAPDGKFLAVVLEGNADNGVMLWQLNDLGSTAGYSVSDGSRFEYGRFSPMGEQYAALSDTAAKLLVWRSMSDSRPFEIQSASSIVDFEWRPNANGQILIIHHANGDVTLQEGMTGKLLTTLHPPNQEYIRLLQVDGEGHRLIVVYESGAIGAWSLPDGNLEWNVEPVGETPTQIAIHADGTRFFGILPSGRVRFWNMEDGRELGTLEKFTTGQVLDLAFSSDGMWIAAGLENGLASLWQSSAEETFKMQLDQGVRVDSVAFAPNATQLATGVGGYINEFAYDDTVQVWDWSNGMLQKYAGERNEVPGCSVFRNQVAFTPDGIMLASISHDFALSIWDLKEQVLWKTLEGHTQPILDMAISADGTTLASASLDGSVRLWQPRQGLLKRILEGDPLGMLAVAMPPDGRLVAGASMTGVIYVWDAESGQLLRTLEGNMNNRSLLAFSADGSLIAAGTGGDLSLWSSETGELITTLPGEGGNIISVAFSNDGRLLVYGSEAGLIHLWTTP